MVHNFSKNDQNLHFFLNFLIKISRFYCLEHKMFQISTFLDKNNRSRCLSLIVFIKNTSEMGEFLEHADKHQFTSFCISKETIKPNFSEFVYFLLLQSQSFYDNTVPTLLGLSFTVFSLKFQFNFVFFGLNFYLYRKYFQGALPSWRDFMEQNRTSDDSGLTSDDTSVDRKPASKFSKTDETIPYSTREIEIHPVMMTQSTSSLLKRSPRLRNKTGCGKTVTQVGAKKLIYQKNFQKSFKKSVNFFHNFCQTILNIFFNKF